MIAVLTDDEIVALANMAGKDWPLPLLTVETGKSLPKAVFRGARSLGVRGLISAEEDPTLGAVEGLVQFVTRAAEADVVVLAHVSPVGQMAVAGAAVAAFKSGDEWLVDSVEGNGVHAMRMLGQEDVTATFTEFLLQSYRSADAEWAEGRCVMASASNGVSALRVEPGVVALGQIVMRPEGAGFEGSADPGAASETIDEFVRSLFIAEGLAKV